MMVETTRRFPMLPTLQAVCLLENNGGDLMFRGCCIFDMTDVVLGRRRFGAASSNYAFCSVCGFESIPVTDISPSFQNRDTREGSFQHFVESPVGILVGHTRCVIRPTGVKTLGVSMLLIQPLQNFNPGNDGFCQLIQRPDRAFRGALACGFELLESGLVVVESVLALLMTRS